jgi:polyphosphate kinase
MMELGKADETILGNLTPAELYTQIHDQVIQHQQKAQEIYTKIWAEMAAENIFVIDETQLTHDQGVLSENISAAGYAQ